MVVPTTVSGDSGWLLISEGVNAVNHYCHRKATQTGPAITHTMFIQAEAFVNPTGGQGTTGDYTPGIIDWRQNQTYTREPK